MKERTPAHLAFAHALVRAAPTVEVFTIGTRLTRITRPLAAAQSEQALTTASLPSRDSDGGTRMATRLCVSCRSALFRAGTWSGAVVLRMGWTAAIRTAMADAVARFSRIAWRIVWLTPLAADPAFEPRTAGLVAARPFLDKLGDGGSIDSICAERARSGKRGRHDPDHRRASSHLAPPRPALARRADAAAHLRAPMKPSGAIIRSANSSPTSPEPTWSNPFTCRPIGPNTLRGRSRLCAGGRRPDRLSARHRRLFRSPGSGRAPTARPAEKYRGMRGVRMQLQWHDNPQYCFATGPDLPRDPALQNNVARLADYGWSFDLQVFTGQMAGAAELANSAPKVTFILQHAGMLEDLSPTGWEKMACRHAAGLRPCPNVVSKLSGLGTFIQQERSQRTSPPSCARPLRCSVPSAACTARIFRWRNCGPNMRRMPRPIGRRWRRSASKGAARGAARCRGPEFID